MTDPNSHEPNPVPPGAPAPLAPKPEVGIDANNSQTPAAAASAVYDELRRLAESFMRRERTNHTLQPTALVNEAFVRLADKTIAAAQGREHFIALAAETMRRVLVDHARTHNAAKRGGPPGQRTRLACEDELPAPAVEVDVLALDDALRKLSLLDERHARVVELKYFGGLSVEQIAGLLNVGTRTVEADWALARAWLRRELGQARPNDSIPPHPSGAGGGNAAA